MAMEYFPDTSFLCSRYREQRFSPQADAWVDRHPGPIPVSALLLLEFRQSTRLHVRLFENDRTKGFSQRQATVMLRDLQADLSLGILKVLPVDWPDVHQIAERLSATHTTAVGHRLADILHVATAIHLAMEGFLTFDDRQRTLAIGGNGRARLVYKIGGGNILPTGFAGEFLFLITDVTGDPGMTEIDHLVATVGKFPGRKFNHLSTALCVFFIPV